MFYKRGLCSRIYDHLSISFKYLRPSRGWSGGAMVLGKLPVPGRPTILMTVGQGPIALAVGAGGGCSDIFTLLYPFFPLSPSLWETARYRLKYCLKGPLNPKQPTNQRPSPQRNRVKVQQRIMLLQSNSKMSVLMCLFWLNVQTSKNSKSDK